MDDGPSGDSQNGTSHPPLSIARNPIVVLHPDGCLRPNFGPRELSQAARPSHPNPEGQFV